MLKVTKLVKRYGGKTAVDGVSFDVRPGEIVGLLGPNGAGKSTTVSMIAGLVTPDSGVVEIGGERLIGDCSALKQRIGLVPQELALFEDLSCLRNLRLFASLYGVASAQCDSRCLAALQLVGLSDRAGERPSAFSGGMKRRLNIAAALIHNPDLVILDEPTVGVDPQSRNAIFENLETLRDEGKALLYTTHYMEEAERLCDRIIVIDHGTIAAQGTLASLLESAAATQRHVRIGFATAWPQDLPLPAALASGRWLDEKTVEFSTAAITASLAELGPVLNQTGVEVASIATEAANLEAVFLALTGRQLRD